MTTDRDRVLSEFIDSYNAGRRPDIDDYLGRVPDDERELLLADMSNYMTWAPTPEFDGSTVAQLRAEPVMVQALARARRRPQSWAEILAARRKALSLSTEQLASKLVGSLGLSKKFAPKTAVYLERSERGELDARRFAPRLLDALADVLKISPSDLSGAAGAHLKTAPSPAFRASAPAAARAREDLELMADLAAAPSQRDWDEVDELFRGGG